MLIESPLARKIWRLWWKWVKWKDQFLLLRWGKTVLWSLNGKVKRKAYGSVGSKEEREGSREYLMGMYVHRKVLQTLGIQIQLEKKRSLAVLPSTKEENGKEKGDLRHMNGRGRPPLSWESIIIEEYVRERVGGRRDLQEANRSCWVREIWRSSYHGHTPHVGSSLVEHGICSKI